MAYGLWCTFAWPWYSLWMNLWHFQQCGNTAKSNIILEIVEKTVFLTEVERGKWSYLCLTCSTHRLATAPARVCEWNWAFNKTLIKVNTIKALTSIRCSNWIPGYFGIPPAFNKFRSNCIRSPIQRVWF